MVCTESEDGLAVFAPHPRDCGLYYECDGTTPVLMECPPGLYWDERENVCNWPEASGCSMEFIKVTSSSSEHESWRNVSNSFVLVPQLKFIIE